MCSVFLFFWPPSLSSISTLLFLQLCQRVWGSQNTSWYTSESRRYENINFWLSARCLTGLIVNRNIEMKLYLSCFFIYQIPKINLKIYEKKYLAKILPCLPIQTFVCAILQMTTYCCFVQNDVVKLVWKIFALSRVYAQNYKTAYNSVYFWFYAYTGAFQLEY